MELYKWLFFFPLFISIIFFLQYFYYGERIYRLQNTRQRIQKKIHKKILSLFGRIVPREGKVYRFYINKILQYSKLTVEKLMYLKIFLFTLTLAIIMLVKITNISIETEEIYNKFDFKVDMIYEYQKKHINVIEAMKQEISYLNIALKKITKTMLREKSPEQIQYEIRRLINEKDIHLYLPRETIVNKIYHRLISYYKVREFNIMLIILVAFQISYLPELYLIIKNILVRVDAKNELRLLKRLIILNGSIKPVDFMEVLSLLIQKSKYYKKILQQIEDSNRKNSIDNKTIYSTYIRQCKDIDLKLFFEKLDEANNCDFDKAILNIENEFKLHRREEIRSIKKQIEFIHIMGILGFMLIITVLIVYLIVPWMQLYDMQEMMI